MTGDQSMPKPGWRLGRGVRAAGRNLGWLLAGRGTDAVLSLLYLGMATRTLGLTDFGRFTLILGASQSLITFIAFPTWQFVIQYGAKHVLAKDDAALGRLLRGCALLDLASAVLGTILSVVILAAFAGRLGIDARLTGYVLAFAIVQLLSLRSTPLGMLRLRDQYARATWAGSVTPVVRVIGAVAAVFFMPTMVGFLLSWAAAEVCTAVAMWYLAGYCGDLKLMWRAPARQGAFLAENPRFARVAISTNASVSLRLTTNQVPLLMIGAYVGPAAAGAFRLAYQLGMGLFKLAPMLTRAAFPELVRAVRTSHVDQLNRLLRGILFASTAVSLVILLIAAVVGRPLLTLVGGHDYASAYPVLLWIAAAGCLDLATVGFEPVMIALHRAGTVFVIQALTTIVLLLAMVMLTPVYGAVGAAIALFLGGLVTETLLAIASFHAVATTPPDTRLDPDFFGKQKKGQAAAADGAGG
jgi:O-antigen/teichoic acid export membrane protein